eukprot:scaffold136345_cov17-Tisochrysis_lutea.AAC.1
MKAQGLKRWKGCTCLRKERKEKGHFAGQDRFLANPLSMKAAQIGPCHAACFNVTMAREWRKSEH